MPSRPRSMKPERRPPTEVSSSVWTHLGCVGASSTVSGWSSTSWPAAVVAASKSGSSSSGGISTTVLRLGGCAGGAACGADGRLGTTGLTLGAGGGAFGGNRGGGLGGGAGGGLCGGGGEYPSFPCV